MKKIMLLLLVMLSIIGVVSGCGATTPEEVFESKKAQVSEVSSELLETLKSICIDAIEEEYKEQVADSFLVVSGKSPDMFCTEITVLMQDSEIKVFELKFEDPEFKAVYLYDAIVNSTETIQVPRTYFLEGTRYSGWGAPENVPEGPISCDAISFFESCTFTMKGAEIIISY